MSDTSAILSLPYLLPAQAQKHVTHNEALRQLDLIVQLSVKARDQSAPPASPLEGDRHIVALGGSGDWAGQSGKIALFAGTEGWLFTDPLPGWRAYVEAENSLVVRGDSGWHGLLENVGTLGVNASADANNRLVVSAPATLLTHEGAGHQLKLNKAAAGDTASMLFQTSWSGRAEMGTTGTDAFAIKVSADGSAWNTALSFDGASGIVAGTAVQQSATDTTAGRLARADHAYGPGNLLGMVSQSGSIPTGAVIERGSNANGAYTRFADGTQICHIFGDSIAADTTIGALYRTGTDHIWTFPVVFTEMPTVTGHVDGGSSWVVMGNGSSTSVGYRRYAAVNDVTAREVRLSAIGHWF